MPSLYPQGVYIAKLGCIERLDFSVCICEDENRPLQRAYNLNIICPTASERCQKSGFYWCLTGGPTRSSFAVGPRPRDRSDPGTPRLTRPMDRGEGIVGRGPWTGAHSPVISHSSPDVKGGRGAGEVLPGWRAGHRSGRTVRNQSHDGTSPPPSGRRAQVLRLDRGDHGRGSAVLRSRALAHGDQ